MSQVDLGAYSGQMATALSGVKSEFESKIESLQNVVESIGWFGVAPDLFYEEIGDVTFSSLQGAVNLVSKIEFTPIPSRDLLGDAGEKHHTHIFESPSLDGAENKIIEILSAGGLDPMKNLSGSMLPADYQAMLFEGQDKSDLGELNTQQGLQNLYPTPDQSGTLDWLNTRHGYKKNDRERLAYSAIFELAQKNINWAYKNGVSIEDLHADFTARYSALVVDITDANIAAYKAEVAANIAELDANLRQVNTELEIESLKLDRESAEWGLKIQQANARLAEYSKNYASVLGSNLQMLNARIAGGKNVADAYKSIFGAYSSQYTGVSMQGGSV